MAKNKEVFRLSRSERKKIEKRRNQESDKRIFRRLSALLGLDDGCSQEEVARFLGVISRTVRRWLKTYHHAVLARAWIARMKKKHGVATLAGAWEICRTAHALSSVATVIWKGLHQTVEKARSFGLAHQFRSDATGGGECLGSSRPIW